MRVLILIAVATCAAAVPAGLSIEERIAYTRTLLLLDEGKVSASEGTPRELPKAALADTLPRAKRIYVFTRKDCSHCVTVRNSLDQLAKQGWKVGVDNGNHVQIVDVVANPDWSAKWRVESLPTLVLVLGDVESKRIVGAVSAAGIRSFWGTDAPVAMQQSDAPEWVYYGPDLAAHLVQNHGFTAAQVAGKTRDELVKLHSAAHNGRR
jgi:thiol-disulfide isomerase/thioredoxin